MSYILSKLLLLLGNPKIILEKLTDLRIRGIIVHNYKKNPQNFFFVQIGSNDGITNDPLHKFIIKYKWKGILVEPVSYLFKKLKVTYKNYGNLIFENIAVAQKNGYKNFYRIKKNSDPNNPVWYDHIGSFEKNVIDKHRDGIPDFDMHLIKEKVRCITFKNLLEKNKVKKVDLLNIDTEGYDYQIIKTINFNKVKPKMILYEHIHLSNRDKNACLQLLRDNGYRIIVNVYSLDTFAYL